MSNYKDFKKQPAYVVTECKIGIQHSLLTVYT
jgi:hypothetical protein